MLKGFKEFILRGNVVDLAVGVVIGAAFGSIVNALVKDLLTPLIGALGHVPDFSGQTLVVNGSTFLYGDFLNSAISFLLVTTSVYFFVVNPMNTLITKAHKLKKPLDPTIKKCPFCLSEIPAGATRCAFCTQAVD